jgi:ribonuclease HI
MKSISIEFTYKTPKGIEGRFRSDELETVEAISIAEDLEKNGRLMKLTFMDNHGNEWTLKQLKKFMSEIKEEPHHITIYFDGGYDIEKRIAGLGCAIYYEQNDKKYRLRKNALVEGLASNNEAEFAALSLSLKELELLAAHHLPVTFIGDSLVVINQLNGDWPCYEEELSIWIDRIEDHMKRLGITPSYEAVSRKNNREADQLATQALREIEIMSSKEIN